MWKKEIERLDIVKEDTLDSEVKITLVYFSVIVRLRLFIYLIFFCRFTNL